MSRTAELIGRRVLIAVVKDGVVDAEVITVSA